MFASTEKGVIHIRPGLTPEPIESIIITLKEYRCGGEFHIVCSSFRATAGTVQCRRGCGVPCARAGTWPGGRAWGEQTEQIVVSVRCRQSGIHGSFAAGDASVVIDAGESFAVPFVFKGIIPTGCTLRVFHPEYVAAYRNLNDDFTQQVGAIGLKSWHTFFDEGPTDPPMHSTYPWPKLEFNQHLSNMRYYYVPAFAEGEQRRRLGRFVVGLHRLTDRAIATGVYGKDGRGESSAIIKDLHRLEDAVEFAASPSRLSALATANDADAIRKLSADGDYVEIWDRNGWSPLLKAASLGNTEAAVALVDGGVKLGRERGVGYGSAMKTALSNRRWQTVAALVGRGAPFDIHPFYNTKIAAALCSLAATGMWHRCG